MKTYLLTFKLKKHKEAKGFQSKVTASDKADIQGIKEEWAMYFENLYNTPVRCTNIEEKSSINLLHQKRLLRSVKLLKRR